MTKHVHDPGELQQACNAAEPGDVILIHGGFYALPARLSHKRGARERPIVIRAADEKWISCAQSPNPYWGGGDPTTSAPTKPGIDDFAFLIFDECAWIVVEGLHIKNCWPSIFYLKDSNHVAIRGCTLRHGTYAVFAKGIATSHLLIQDNEWQQDDSGRLWREINWGRAHGNEGTDGIFRYFNGGFLSTKGVLGHVVVQGNRIKDAYNGVRMKSDDRVPCENSQVHIVGNEFVRIRDNPIEPEVAAYHWQVRHNTMLDCHSWFSVDGVRGGYWYVYGNTGFFETRQGKVGEFGHTMGRVLKLSYETRPANPDSIRVPDHPWFVFNNSWYLRCPIVGGASPQLPELGEGPDFTAHLGFFNNAFTWCDPGLHGEWVCELIELMRFFDLAKSPATSFDYDITDRADYLAYFQRDGQGEAHGVLATRPIFDDPAAGRFTLPGNSQARDCGRTEAVELADSRGLAELQLQANGLLSRGAYQDYGLTKVPLLEAATDDLLAELAQDPAPSLRRRTPIRRKEAPAKKKGSDSLSVQAR